MIDPARALLVFALLVIALAVVAWPRRGLAALVLRFTRLTQRARIEDALKRIHESEYAGQPCTIDSVAGWLQLSRSRTMRLLARLQALGLTRVDADHLTLPDGGRGEALRVLRSHRLWERYLADRTGVPAGEWHDEAEQREHTLTPEAVRRLAAAMGDPRYDPHGDPIPTADGEVPPRAGVALTALVPGQTAAVVHLEDEPRDVYEQLLAAGLAPGTMLEVLERTPEHVRFATEGTEHTIGSVSAMNVSVVLPRGRVDGLGAAEPLSSLAPGESAAVVGIAPGCQGPQRRRLLDLGLVPGTVVTAELRGPLRDPVAYRVRGALIALRREQADWIRVDRRVPAETG
jgi:DtxR family Mn-dependent transcriptional regulator